MLYIPVLTEFVCTLSADSLLKNEKDRIRKQSSLCERFKNNVRVIYYFFLQLILYELIIQR